MGLNVVIRRAGMLKDYQVDPAVSTLESFVVRTQTALGLGVMLGIEPGDEVEFNGIGGWDPSSANCPGKAQGRNLAYTVPGPRSAQSQRRHVRSVVILVVELDLSRIGA